MKIPCTIGILTHNSMATLPRALASVRDFAEVIVADSASSDSTRSYAISCGARVIDQSNPGHAIEDFALERNKLLDAATQPWFFYLDSDEVMSEELRDDIRRATEQSQYGAYRVRYLKTNADVSKIYRTFREYYQIRLTRTDIGARFMRRVHERIVPPPGTRIGRIEGAWYVPLDDGDLHIRNFAPKAWRRTYGTMQAWNPKGIVDIMRKVIRDPSILVAKSLIKMIATPLMWGRQAIPLRYEALRILYACMLSIRALERVIRRTATKV